MNFEPNQKPELIASKDPARQHIAHTYLDTSDPADPRLVATDGHRLISVPVALAKESTDHPGPIAKESLAAARKWAKKAKLAYAAVEACAGVLRQLDGASQPRPTTTMDFPPWRKVVPSYRAGSPGTVTLCFNARMLAELAKAAGSKQVVRQPDNQTTRREVAP